MSSAVYEPPVICQQRDGEILASFTRDSSTRRNSSQCRRRGYLAMVWGPGRGASHPLVSCGWQLVGECRSSPSRDGQKLRSGYQNRQTAESGRRRERERCAAKAACRLADEQCGKLATLDGSCKRARCLSDSTGLFFRTGSCSFPAKDRFEDSWVGASKYIKGGSPMPGDET